jgi:hypothetical protein
VASDNNDDAGASLKMATGAGELARLESIIPRKEP